MQFPVFIELHRSVLLTFLLVLFHALAAASVSALPWPWLLRSALFVLVCLSLWSTLRPNRILWLHLCARDRLEGVLSGGGHREVLSVLPDSTAFSRLIVLRVRIGDGRGVSRLTLLPDQMSPEQFRLLCLWLRWYSEPKSPAVQSS